MLMWVCDGAWTPILVINRCEWSGKEWFGFHCIVKACQPLSSFAFFNTMGLLRDSEPRILYAANQTYKNKM